MDKRELEDTICNLLIAIRNIYKQAYPNANYLSMTIRKDTISFNNHPVDDALFRIDFMQSDDWDCTYREGKYEDKD